MLLKGGQEKHHHQQAEQRGVQYVTAFFHPSEPKVDEGTETAGVQGTKAENEGQDTDNERDDMLPLVVVGEVDLVLHLQADLRQGEEREEGRHEHGDIEVRIVAEMERREVESEEPLDEKPRQVDSLNAEEAARQDDDEEGEKHRRDASQTLIELLQKQLVSADEDTLQGTVNHEIPRCAMPQTADEEAEP